MKPIVFVLSLFGVVAPALAHHSNDYHFDSNVSVTVTGTVKDFRFINPHSRILVDVVAENGDIVTWDCEMGAANGLKRRGWTEAVFRPGEAIEIQGFAARRHPTECYFDYAVLAGGRQITMEDTFGDSAVAGTVASEAPGSIAAQLGVPDFTRVWQRQTGGGGGGGPRLGGPNRQAWALSEAGRRALDAYDPVLDDPALECSPVSIARLWGNGDLTEIHQQAGRVTIHHEWMDAERIVHLGSREHPSAMPSNVLGHSIGWYEDQTLVIDTIGYPAGMLHQHPGLPHSDKLHTVERLVLSDNGGGFELSYTLDDAEYLTAQLVEERSFAASAESMREYNCTHPEIGH
jgi:hypothetical protein